MLTGAVRPDSANSAAELIFGTVVGLAAGFRVCGQA